MASSIDWIRGYGKWRSLTSISVEGGVTASTQGQACHRNNHVKVPQLPGCRGSTFWWWHWYTAPRCAWWCACTFFAVSASVWVF